MITFENLNMMRQRIRELERDGFVKTGAAGNAVYFSKGADHRVVTNTGVVKRGQPGFRNNGGARHV